MAVGSSTIVADLRGSVGNVVFSRTRTGVRVRARTVPRDPRTPKQQAARIRMAQVSAAWAQMTLDQARAWAAYAETLAAPDPATGLITTPRANLVFTRLALKFRQMDEYAPIPLEPPAGVFGGDSIPIAATGQPGQVTFTALGSNRPGVRTELLLQPLASVHRRIYPDKYRSSGFVPFTPTLEIIQLVPPGLYACAIRFVETATGRETGILPLGVVDSR